jgi:chromosome segregation ATPase
MRIEELILEGFKSYPVRTQITGWDTSFNAITGLNGSGKSNILDAICFVLGLTNMSSVRGSNSSHSVYKLISFSDAGAESARSHLQTWTGWHHESLCHHRL